MVSSLRFEFREKETSYIPPVKAKMKGLSLRTSGRPLTPGIFQATPSTPLKICCDHGKMAGPYQLFSLIDPFYQGRQLLRIPFWRGSGLYEG
jgi:hypothetical protein